MKCALRLLALFAAAAILFTPTHFAVAGATEYYPSGGYDEYEDSATDGTLYARAGSREAYFCTSADLSTSIFAVPYTYCVEVLSEEGEWYRAKYAEDYGIYRAVYGYVLKSDFELLDEAPQTVYLYKPVTVTFSQPPAGGLPAIDDITVQAAFYGSYYSGAAGYSYVLCQGSFGYIAGANDDYPLIETQPPPDEEQTPQSQNANGTVIAAVVIGILVVAALALALLSGRKPRRKKNETDPFNNEFHNERYR